MKKIKRRKSKSKPFVVRMDPAVNEAVDEALAMFDQGRMRAAEKIILELLRKHPDIHTVQYAMGVVCAAKGLYEKSIAFFDRAIAIYPYLVEAWFNKGAAHQKRLEVGEAIRAYQKVVELGNPEEDFVRHARDVLRDYEQYLRKDKGLSLAAYLKGKDTFDKAFAAMERKEWEKALKGFREVAAMNPKHTQSHGNMGICYGQLGRKQEALAAFDKALALDPKYAPALQNRAIVSALEEGEALDADIEPVDYYREAFKKSGSAQAPGRKRAAVARPLQKPGVRLLEYEITFDPLPSEHFAALPPHVQETINRLYYLAQDSPREAIGELRRMIEEYPDIPMLYNYLSGAYASAGMREEAERVIEENYRRNPEYLFARLNYADLCLRRRDYDTVLELLKGKFDLKDYYPERSCFHISEFTGFSHVVGTYLALTGKRDAAMVVYEGLRRVAPKHPSTKHLREILLPSLARKLLRRIRGE
jgi:tetratricopeptide (TPR) repeat protein